MTNYTHKIIPLHNNDTNDNHSIIITKTNNPGNDEKLTVFKNLNAKDTGHSIISGVINTYNTYSQRDDHNANDHHHFIIYHNYFYNLLSKNITDNIPGILKSVLNNNISLHAKKLPRIKNGSTYDSSIHLIKSMCRTNDYTEIFNQEIITDYNKLYSFQCDNKNIELTPQDCYDNIEPGTMIIHTDGSYNERRNIGVTSIFNSEDTTLSRTIAIENTGEFDSNHMEFLGVYYAALSVPKNKKAIIFTDSKRVVKILNNVNNMRYKVLNKECEFSDDDNEITYHSMIKKLVQLDNVEYRWVKGHYNDYHNRVVDLMCRHVRRFIEKNENHYDSQYFSTSFSLTYHGQNCVNDINNNVKNSVNFTGIIANPVELIHNIQCFNTLNSLLQVGK